MSDLHNRLTKLREGWVETPLDVYQPRNGLDEPQFTADDVTTATGITASQLHNWTTRDWGFRFAMGNPGKGKRRLFSAMDIVTLQVTDALSVFGMVQVAAQWSRTGWTTGRVGRLFTDPTVQAGLVYRLVLVRNDDRTNADWRYIPEGSGDEAKTGPAYVRLEFDRLIIEALENVLAIVSGEPMPARDLLSLQSPEDARREAEDWYGVRDVDAEGREIKTGLTFEETAELQALEDRQDAAQAHDYSTGPFIGGNTPEQRMRRSELLERHWEASRAKRNADMEAARAAREAAGQ